MNFIYRLPVLMLLAWVQAAYAQTDSTAGKLLKEVTVQANGELRNFNFHQSSKLSGTEEILSRMKGVNLIGRGPYGMEPMMRFYSASQISITLDGMHIYGACTDKMDPASVYIEPVNLSSISAEQGATGNEFGSSIGGNINFRFKVPEVLCHTKTTAGINQSYATNNRALNSNFFIDHAAPSHAWRISGAWRKAQDYNTPDSLMPHSGFEKFNLSAMYRYSMDSANQLLLTALTDRGRNIGYPALPMDVSAANATMFSVSWLTLPQIRNYHIRSETRIYANYIEHYMDDTHRPVYMHMDMPGWSRTLGAFHEAGKRIQQQLFKLRADYHENRLQADMTMYPNNGDPAMYMQTLPANYLKDAGLFLQYENINKGMGMKVNARADRMLYYAEEGVGARQWQGMGYDITSRNIQYIYSASVQFCLKPGSRFTKNLLLSYGERMASANERIGFYLYHPSDNSDYLGNPNLKKEKSLQAEIQTGSRYKNVEWQAQFFAHHNPDAIYADTLSGYYPMTWGARYVKGYRNIAYTRSMGIEAVVSWRIRENILLRSDWRYIYAYNNAGAPLPMIPPLKVQNALRWQVSQHSVQIEWIAAAAQKRINPDFGEYVSTGYSIFNLRWSKNFMLGKTILQGGAALENIANARWYEHQDVLHVPRMGRNLTLSVGLMLR